MRLSRDIGYRPTQFLPHGEFAEVLPGPVALSGPTQQPRVYSDTTFQRQVSEIMIALNAIGHAGFAVTEQKQVVGHSERASVFIGNGLRIDRGELVAGKKNETAKINALLQQVICLVPQSKTPTGGSCVLRGDGSPIILYAYPLLEQVQTGHHRLAAILIAVDPEAEVASDAQLIQQYFGLTIQEARVAALLATGCALPEIAVALELTLNTVRQLIKAVLQKSGTHRQSEFVARAARLSLSPAVRWWPDIRDNGA